MFILFQIFRVEKGLYEVLLVELLEVFDMLPDPYVSYRDMELVAHSYHNSTLRCAVQLGNAERGDVGGAGELTGLLEGILPRGGIKDQHHFVRTVGDDLAYDIADFG